MTETPIPHTFKVGDSVANKNAREEHGEIVAVSPTGKSIRVLLQPPNFGKLWWFSPEELEPW